METIKVVASVTPLWRQRSKTISPPPGPVRDRRGFLAVAGREGDFPPLAATPRGFSAEIRMSPL